MRIVSIALALGLVAGALGQRIPGTFQNGSSTIGNLNFQGLPTAELGFGVLNNGNDLGYIGNTVGTVNFIQPENPANYANYVGDTLTINVPLSIPGGTTNVSSLQYAATVSEPTGGFGPYLYFGFPTNGAEADAFTFTPTGQPGHVENYLLAMNPAALGEGYGNTYPITDVLYQVEPNGSLKQEPSYFPTPEPAPFALFGLASVGLFWRRRSGR